MSSQRFIYGSVVVLLFLLNALQGLFILKSIAGEKTNQTNNPASIRAGILSDDLQEVLDVLKVSELRLCDLTVLVPPSPCQACVNSQNAIIYEMGRKYPEKQIELIVLNSVEKDYRAFYSELKNITIKTYATPEDNSKEDLWLISDGGYIYFTGDAGRIKDFYIMDKKYPEASRLFVTRVLE